MMRHLARLGLGASAGTAAGASTAHARHQGGQGRSLLQQHGKAGAGPPEEDETRPASLDADWLFAEVEAGNAVMEVHHDVLREQLEQLFPQMGRQASREQQEADSDMESTTTVGEHANSLIEQASHMQLMAPESPLDAPINDITSMLTNVLNNAAVQQACCAAFRQDPMFADFVRREPGRDMNLFLPQAASACTVTEVTDQENDDVAVTWQALLDGMGTTLVKMGDALQDAGEKVGHFFGQVGRALQSKLRPATAAAARQEGARPCKGDIWMGALTTVAVAVLFMLLGSGKVRVRAV